MESPEMGNLWILICAFFVFLMQAGFLYQMMFCGTAATIVSVAVSERIKDTNYCPDCRDEGEENKKKCLDCGVNDFLFKPIDVKLLVQKLSQYL